MELKYIEAFLKIVQTGSFSSAAELLYISQPTISVRIQQLEKVLAKPLFIRVDGKKAKLTTYGEKVLPYFEEAFDLIQKGIEVINEDLDEKTLVISCPNHMGLNVMPELLSCLYEKFPSIDFKVKINMKNMVNNTIEGIRNGEVDIGFIYATPNKIESYKGISMVHVSEEQNILVCGLNHPLANIKEISIDRLINERVFLYDRHLLSTRMIEDFLKENHLTAYKKVEINNLSWIKNMVRKGLGVAFLQKIMVKDEIENNELMEITINEHPPKTSIYLIFGSNLDINIKQLTIDTTRELFKSK